MTIIVANTSNTNTFDYWKNRTNELADAMSNYVVTTDSNTAVGNAAVSNTFTANTLVALNNISGNNVSVETSVNVGNSTVNVSILTPNSSQISSGNYYLNANGSWTENTSAPVSNGVTSTSGTSAQLIDSFSTSSYNAVEYYVHIENTTATGFHASKILVLHSDTAAQSTEYATIFSNNNLGLFSANVDSGTVRLYLTPNTASANISFTRVNF